MAGRDDRRATPLGSGPDGDEFAGKVALITGAAGGLGSAIAGRMIAAGLTVAVADVDAERAERVLPASNAAGAGARAFGLDVTRRDAILDTVAEIEAWAGAVDVLVNAAGVNSHYPALELPEEEWDRIIDVNLKGTFLMTQAVAGRMRSSANASVINISSAAAEVASASNIHYAASKGGVRQLTKGFAVALAPLGIRVNAIAPGPIVTDLNRHRLSDPDIRSLALARIPLGRFGSPMDVAGVALFLASRDAAFITGASIGVDGGLLAMR